MEANGSGSPAEVVVDVVKAGALPATLVAGVGDFFAPVGAWVLPLVMGLFAALLLVLLAAYSGMREKILCWLLKPTRSDLWSRPFYRSRVFFSLFVFAAVGIVFGSVSQARQERGGMLASELGQVAALQGIMGVAEESLKEQRRTREGVDDLVDVSQTGRAKNPRVTLRNLGVDWNAANLDEALINHDMQTVGLFIAGGMSISQSVDTAEDLARFFRDFSPEVASVLLDHRDRVTEEACLPMDADYAGSLSSWLEGDARRTFYVALCNKPGVMERLRSYASAEEQRRAELLSANASVSSDRDKCRARLKRDLTIEKAVGLGLFPSVDGNQTIDAPEERVAAALQMLLMQPGLDDRSLVQQYGKLIDTACEESFVERPVPEGEGFYEGVLDMF